MTIDLAIDAACQVHATLSGHPTTLAGLVTGAQAALAAGEAVTWRVPVSAKTVHHIEGVFLLARELGVSCRLEIVETLEERERAFFDDFVQHGLAEGRRWRSSVRVAARVAEEAWFGLRALPGSLTWPTPVSIDTAADVTIIGAYGGDHIGDAAILGGVLLSLHARYGVQRATLLSFRPEHTRRLAAGLETPVALTVRHYDGPTAIRTVNASQALVIAGGPVMDLPRVLVKHLVAANAARRGRKPLIVERVGIGPFRRTVSRRAARLLLRQASALTTRTIAASKDPIVAGLPVGVGRDPAFDYLTPREHLSRLTSRERDSVDELLAGTEGHIVIGINVRPIGHGWSQKGSSYARKAEDQFNEALALAISRFSASAPQPVTFVAFAMNPIQFGRSDLASAFRIHRAVGPSADFRVWEADPDVDGMLYLLRHCHAVIGVRFHACIFALSQGIPTIGADYYPGGGGKVQDLFRDLGKPDDVRVMDEITAEWLEARLQAAVWAPNRHARPWRSSMPPSGSLERQS